MFKNIMFGINRPIKALSIVALAFTLAGGLVTQSAWADLPNTPANVKVMDTNHNGKIEKQEYLAYMGTRFDRAAGSKGYCSFEEISAGLKKLGSAFPESNSID